VAPLVQGPGTTASSGWAMALLLQSPGTTASLVGRRCLFPLPQRRCSPLRFGVPVIPCVLSDSERGMASPVTVTADQTCAPATLSGWTSARIAEAFRMRERPTGNGRVVFVPANRKIVITTTRFYDFHAKVSPQSRSSRIFALLKPQAIATKCFLSRRIFAPRQIFTTKPKLANFCAARNLFTLKSYSRKIVESTKVVGRQR
jgi:hypothetical protein